MSRYLRLSTANHPGRVEAFEPQQNALYQKDSKYTKKITWEFKREVLAHGVIETVTDVIWPDHGSSFVVVVNIVSVLLSL